MKSSLEFSEYPKKKHQLIWKKQNWKILLSKISTWKLSECYRFIHYWVDTCSVTVKTSAVILQYHHKRGKQQQNKQLVHKIRVIFIWNYKIKGNWTKCWKLCAAKFSLFIIFVCSLSLPLSFDFSVEGSKKTAFSDFWHFVITLPSSKRMQSWWAQKRMCVIEFLLLIWKWRRRHHYKIDI